MQKPINPTTSRTAPATIIQSGYSIAESMLIRGTLLLGAELTLASEPHAAAVALDEVQKCPRLPLFPDGTKKRPQRGAVALRPLQFRRPTGDLGGGPIGASPSTGKTQYGLIQAASAEKVPSTVS